MENVYVIFAPNGNICGCFTDYLEAKKQLFDLYITKETCMITFNLITYERKRI